MRSSYEALRSASLRLAMPASKPAYLTSKNAGEDAGMAGQEAGATVLRSAGSYMVQRAGLES